MPTENVYAQPRIVTDLNDCYFYHTMDIPGFGLVEGEWDLRKSVDAYIGNVDVRRKRVLELGSASGFVGFYLESRGAEVVAYDLSDQQDWDVVPYARSDYHAFAADRRDRIRRLNNAYWLCHRALGSKAKVVYGDVYSIPPAIGPVDISIFGSILLHLRDPFLALQKGLALTRETVIVTDMASRLALPFGLSRYRQVLPPRLSRPSIKFLPDWRTGEPKETWWQLTPEIIGRVIGVLGFEILRVTYHDQQIRSEKGWRKRKQFTVVGRRSPGLLHKHGA